MTLIGPKLFSSSNNGKILTIPDKNSALTRCNIDFAVLCIINIEVGSNIKDEIL